MDTNELRALLEDATPGPWEPRHEVVSMGAGFNGHRMFVGHDDGSVTGTVAHLTEITKGACPETERQLRVGVFPAWKRGEPIPWHPDIRLIVAMRNALPALLDRLDALEAVAEAAAPFAAAWSLAQANPHGYAGMRFRRWVEECMEEIGSDHHDDIANAVADLTRLDEAQP